MLKEYEIHNQKWRTGAKFSEFWQKSMEESGGRGISPLNSGNAQYSPEKDGIFDLEWQDPRVGLAGQDHLPHLPSPFYSIVNSLLRDTDNKFFFKWGQNEKLEAYLEYMKGEKKEERNLTNKNHTASIPH